MRVREQLTKNARCSVPTRAHDRDESLSHVYRYVRMRDVVILAILCQHDMLVSVRINLCACAIISKQEVLPAILIRKTKLIGTKVEMCFRCKSHDA